MRMGLSQSLISFTEMLIIDFSASLRLGGLMCEDRDDLISRLFAMLTAKLENCAADAASGQGRGHDQRLLTELADRVQNVCEEIGLVAEATKALTAHRGR